MKDVVAIVLRALIRTNVHENRDSSKGISEKENIQSPMRSEMKCEVITPDDNGHVQLITFQVLVQLELYLAVAVRMFLFIRDII